MTNEKTTWEMGRIYSLDDCAVTLSKPVFVGRSKGYFWFPSLMRLPSGDLVAKVSGHSDTMLDICDLSGVFLWSSDGGLTWGAATSVSNAGPTLCLPSGDTLILPFYLKQSGHGLRAPCHMIPAGARRVESSGGSVEVSGWPRPGRSFSPDMGLGGFVFNGQTVQTEDGGYLATLYGYFQGAGRYSLVAACSSNGVEWRIRSVIADENCVLEGSEGPCESALCRLKDGRLMCVFRRQGLDPVLTYGQTWSSDEGIIWTTPAAMIDVFSVEPSLAMIKNGTLVLSGGRLGVYLWVNTDGVGKAWQKIDIVNHHNECHPQERIVPIRPHRFREGHTVVETSSYTEVVALDDTNLLCIFDRVPNGWEPIPEDMDDTNSVWVVRVSVDKE